MNAFCLQMEILHAPLQQQLGQLLGASDYSATTDLMAALRPATVEQLTTFLEQQGQSTDAQSLVLRVMAAQKTQNAEELSQRLLHHLDGEPREIRDIGFMALSQCAPEVCGKHLLTKHWKAGQEDTFVARYGSDAIAHASKALNFDEVKALIAPWRWLHAAVVRGNQVPELQSASASLVQLVLNTAIDIPEFPAEFSLHSSEEGLANLSVGQSRRSDTWSAEFFAKEGPIEEVNRHSEELSKSAAGAIQKIRASGCSLYLQPFEVAEVRQAYRCAPRQWHKLLDGAEHRTEAFLRRVRSAEGLYMALCETLLELDPSRGALLWSALTDAVRTNMKGAAGISEFIHMIFRVPSSPDVAGLREDLVKFASTSTDLVIFNLVIVAQFNGREDWLNELIDRDDASKHPWRRKRAVMLKALSASPDPECLAWPSGLPITSSGRLESRMAKWCNRGALARLWWSKFLGAPDEMSAFAAWNVFLSCADRRAYVLMRGQALAASASSELDRLRALHVRMNRDHIELMLKVGERKPNDLQGHLFGLDTPALWLDMDAVAK